MNMQKWAKETIRGSVDVVWFLIVASFLLMLVAKYGPKPVSQLSSQIAAAAGLNNPVTGR